MKLAWVTDIHLNFVEKEGRINFYNGIVYENVNGILLTGDIAEALSVVPLLQEMAHYVQQPIYFVLGNHDYYHSDIKTVRQQIFEVTQTNPFLQWLPAIGVKVLKSDTVLIGQDGWADGRLGNYQQSPVVLNDSRMIADLFQEKLLGKSALLNKMQALADSDAESLKKTLQETIQKGYKKIIVLSHIPPFKEACLHQGVISNDDWLPYFSTKATGDVLISLAEKHPVIEFFVLCGHTHSASFYQPLDNLRVKSGCAKYYQPKIQEIVIL